MKTIRSFQLLEQKGSGTTGEVFRAIQTTLDRPVAVKVLHPRLSRHEDLIRGFEREAKIAATLQHENIVTVIDFGREGEDYFLAMEYVEGCDLKALIADTGHIPLPVCMSIAIDLLHGLAHAHFRGIVHGDIKPANVLLSRAGIAKIGDFSTAQASAQLTADGGDLSGSPSYMSPEQAKGLPIDHRTDLFSLGVVLYEMLAGVQPFRGESYSAVLENLISSPPPDLGRLDPAIPERIAQVVRRALEKLPGDRFASATDFLRDLEQACRDEQVLMARVFVVDFIRDPLAFREGTKRDFAGSDRRGISPAAGLVAPGPSLPSAWFGIRAKWTLWIGAALATALLPASYLTIERVRDSMTDSANRAGDALAEQLAEFSTEAVLSQDDLAMARAIEVTMHQRGVRYAVMFLPDGTILASSGASDLAGRLTPAVLQDGAALSRALGVEEENLFHAGAPVQIRYADKPAVVLAQVRVGYSFAEQTAQIRKFVVTLAALNGAGLAAALVFSALLARQFAHPILSLSKLAGKVATGDFRVASNLRRRDEIGVLAHSFDQMAAFLQRGQFLRHAFERYVSPELADFIDKNPTALAAGTGERRDVTVLFLDIRGFTRMSEKMAPEEVVTFLVTFFNRMSAPVFACEGSIDKFIGDAMMAVFGFPVGHGDDPFRAVTAAVRMQQLVAAYNQERALQGKEPVGVGIGINSGSVIAGNMGCERKLDYTVIGDSVNVASRLAAQASAEQVLISGATYRLLSEKVVVDPLGARALKGRAEPVEVYQVRALVNQSGN